MERIIALLTGARRGEVARTLISFSSLFLLLSSYYMVKPLRNSQFLKEFNSDMLPFFFLFTALLAIGVTKLFSSFYGKVSHYRLVVYTYLTVMACKLIFHFFLPVGGEIAIVFFYLWASVYFLLSVAVLWGCINYIFTSQEGERTYGFIAIGGMLGSMAGSYISAIFSEGAFKDYALIFSALVMGCVIVSLYFAMRQERPEKPEQRQGNGKLTSETREKRSFFSEFQDMWQNRYVRSIAVMMYSIAAFNTVLEFQSQQVIDQQMAEQVYLTTFNELNQSLNQLSGSKADVLNPQGLEFVFGLKGIAESQRETAMGQFLNQQGISNVSPDHLISQYKNYQDHKEAQTRALFSTIYFYQNVLGVFLLFFVSRILFKYMGVRFTIMILPSFYTLVIVSLFFPIDIFMIETFLVVGYGLNYSLNRATRELLYTKTSSSTIFRLKPFIDGPIRRLGDVTMALFKLALTVILVKALQQSHILADQIFYITSLGILAFWIYSVWYVGGQYDQLKKTEEEA